VITLNVNGGNITSGEIKVLVRITNYDNAISGDSVLDYTLPIASNSILGGIKVGTGLTIDGTGILSTTYTYTLPIASDSILGGIKVGSGLSIDGSGILSVTPITLTTTGTSGVATLIGETLNIPDYSFTLPIASPSVLGGIKVGNGLSIDGSGILSSTITDTFTTATDYSYSIPANIVIFGVIVDSTVSYNLNIGTTVGGTDILNADPIAANVPLTISLMFYAKTNSTLYFSGITGSTKIIILKTTTP
jgi:hypothetical protein